MKPKPTHAQLLPLYAVAMVGLIAVAITILSGCAATPQRLTRADMTPAQLAQPEVQQTFAAQDESDRHNARFMWGCQGADMATTGIGLAVGLAEANPLGLLIVPIALIAEHQAQKNHVGEKVIGAAHCGAAAWNLAMIL